MIRRSNRTCQLCTETAFAPCTRCETTFCMEHAPMPGTRCLRCELGYHNDKQVLRPYFRIGAVISIATFVWLFLSVKDGLPLRSGGMRAITTGFPVIDLFILCVLGAVVMSAAVGTSLGYIYRRRFLAERSRD